MAHLLYPILKNLDKNRFETTLFWYGKGDNSEIENGPNLWIMYIIYVMIIEFRAEILNLNIDLLFDLKGWTINVIRPYSVELLLFIAFGLQVELKILVWII